MDYHMHFLEFFKIVSLRKINGNALMRPPYSNEGTFSSVPRLSSRDYVHHVGPNEL